MAVLIIFPVFLTTVINLIMLSIGGHYNDEWTLTGVLWECLADSLKQRQLFVCDKRQRSAAVVTTSCPDHIHPSINVKSFLGHKAHREALISVFLSQTPVYTARPWMHRLVHQVVCLFTSQVWLVVIVPMQRGMARLSWPGWLITYWDGLAACRLSPIQVLTGPGVD